MQRKLSILTMVRSLMYFTVLTVRNNIKNLNKFDMRRLILTMVLCIISIKIFAQNSFNDQLDAFMNYYTELLTALTIVWGYVARFIPKLKDVPMKVINVIAFIIVVGGAFLWMDLTSPIQVVIAAFSAAGIYSYILKPGSKLLELISKYLPLLIDLIRPKRVITEPLASEGQEPKQDNTAKKEEETKEAPKEQKKVAKKTVKKATKKTNK